ncbi:MAG: hypothetical protein V4568_16390 [Pseudomonadota bacterium]
MRKVLLQFFLCLIALVVNVVLSAFNPAWSLLGILVVPAVFLAWLDIGRALRKTSSSNAASYALGVLVGLPQAVFGLVCLIAGVAITVAFFFGPVRGEDSNWIVFLVGPLLMCVGIWWLRDSFRSGQAKK